MTIREVTVTPPSFWRVGVEALLLPHVIRTAVRHFSSNTVKSAFPTETGGRRDEPRCWVLLRDPQGSAAPARVPPEPRGPRHVFHKSRPSFPPASNYTHVLLPATCRLLQPPLLMRTSSLIMKVIFYLPGKAVAGVAGARQLGSVFRGHPSAEDRHLLSRAGDRRRVLMA